MRLSLDLGLGSVATLNAGGGVNLAAFMAGQADGLWFDTASTDRFFQESTGPTLADDVGEAMGLALDQRTWGGTTPAEVLATATELVANGGFDANVSGWSAQGSGGTTFSWSSGAMQVVRNGDILGYPGQTLSGLTVGRTYRVRVTNSGASPANLRLTGTAAANTTVAAGATIDHYFVAVATTQLLGFWPNNDLTTIVIDNVSAKLVPGNHASQATGTLKPTRQTTGAKFDGSDDNWLTPYLAQSGASFLGVRTSVPSTLAATQVILGASGASANRCFIGVDTSGRACGGVGSDSTTTIVGTSDLRNTEADIFLTFDGAAVRLIVNGVVEYEAAQNSTPTTTIPFRVGANNNNGTAGSFYAGAVREPVVGREFITASRARQIANQF